MKVNSDSSNNQQISATYNSSNNYPDRAIWYAEVLESSEFFVAMFNLQMGMEWEFNTSLTKLHLGGYEQCDLYDIWNDKNIGKTVNGFITQKVATHDVAFLRLNNCIP